MNAIARVAALVAMVTAFDQGIAGGYCGISFAANHQGDPHLDGEERSRSHLSIDLLRSQYRVGNEPWRSTQQLCSIDRLDLAEGETAAISCRTDLACGRYQFLFRVDSRQSNGELIETRVITFPTNAGSVDVRRPRTVHLGNLRELFDARESGSGPRRRTAQLVY